MFKSINVFGAILAALLLAGCGDTYTTNNTDPNNPSDPPPVLKPPVGSPSQADSLILQFDTDKLGSSNQSTVNLTAIVKNIDNVKLAGEAVRFTSDGGALEVDNSGLTNGAGFATAKLTTFGDPYNRIIRVSAFAQENVGASSSVDIEVSGTTINISGAESMVFGSKTTLTIFLKDSAGEGLAQQNVSITSQQSNFPTSTITTGAGGQAQFEIAITQLGNDKITVSALGATAEHNITVSNDEFTFSTPVAQELEIGTIHPITVTWKTGGEFVIGETISLSATRGTILEPNILTDANGNATFSISSLSSGPTVITAKTIAGPTTSIEREFVALVPDTLVVQADQITIGPNKQQSTITATVRDVNNNLVKNIPISFSIFNDVSGGDITNSVAVTGSLGRASTVYISSGTSTALDGVSIRASVFGSDCSGPVPTNPLCKEIRLTVSEIAVSVRLGTNNLLGVNDPLKYQKDYSILVTDSAGNGKAGANVELTLAPTIYYTGYREWSENAGQWQTRYSFACPSEDTNKNNFLDEDADPNFNEDKNNNGVLDPGKIAEVNKTIVTDVNGFAVASIIYPRDHALYTDVLLTATAKVDSTEGTDSVNFTLPILVDDITDKSTVPGPVSPWGAVNSCTESPGLIPKFVFVTPSFSPLQIKVSWQPVINAQGYNIYRSTTPNIIVTDNTTYDNVFSSSTTPYIDSAIAADTVYYYVVTANVDNSGTIVESDASSEVSAISVTPAAPTP